MANTSHAATAGHGAEGTRRDFLYLTAGAFGAVGTGLFLWPFIHSMNPSADVLALSTTEVDISSVQPGQSITVTWRGKPVFVRRRTPQEVDAARKININELPDPQADQARVQKPEWLILVGVCTHLGCVPLGQKSTDPRGEYGGWFCPCHGSHYDTSGRIRKGPAPANLPVPTYTFLTDTTVRIG
jgi:ubiquinol-cytochrome c reductase iron-sulfur subunit